MVVQHVNLRAISNREKKKIDEIVLKVIKSGSYVLGPQVREFEEDFSKYLGVRYTVGLNSGTDGIFLALKALQVRKGDEIIVPTMSFMATVSPILQLEATPVFVDSLEDNPNMDTSAIERVITRRTKVIIPVHMNGYPCDMTSIRKIAKKYSLAVLEDACQSHGSMYKNKRAGSLSDMAAFSFYPSKNLGALGDAGAIVTRSRTLYRKVTSQRNHGQTERYIHREIGWNSRMDSVQAAILSYKLTLLDEKNVLRRKKAEYYKKRLCSLPLIFPSVDSDRVTNYHNFVILTERRNTLQTFLKERGISTGVHYPIPLHLQPALNYLGYKKGDFPHAESYANQCLSLPLYPEITKKEQDEVIKSVKDFFLSSSSKA